jgi:Co/Zn/Cd efflux system component
MDSCRRTRALSTRGTDGQGKEGWAEQAEAEEEEEEEAEEVVDERKLVWEQMDIECARVTKIGAGANLGLSIVKLGAGIAGNSVAMVADAVHSLSDLISDLITYYAVKIALKPVDAVRPYGYGKFESLGALGVSGILVLTGAGVGMHSLDSLHVFDASNSGPEIAVRASL